jgi:hypothetical protein
LALRSTGSGAFIQPRSAGELLAHRREVLVFLLGGLVASERPAVHVEQVGLVEFPDLEPERVLDRVTALLAEVVGPPVFVLDQVVAAACPASDSSRAYPADRHHHRDERPVSSAPCHRGDPRGRRTPWTCPEGKLHAMISDADRQDAQFIWDSRANITI